MAEATVNKSMVRVLSMRGRRWPAVCLIAVSCIVPILMLAGVTYYYNSFVALRQDVNAANYQIDSAVQLRANLFPLLVEAVVRFVSHEDRVFDHTSDARTESMGHPTRKEVEDLIQKARTDWRGALPRIMAWAENYPDLKTSESFQLMMSQMSEVEKEIYERRVAYNDAVNIYTTALRSFPRNTVALVFRFEMMPYYQIDGESEWRIARGDSPKSGESDPK